MCRKVVRHRLHENSKKTCILKATAAGVVGPMFARPVTHWPHHPPLHHDVIDVRLQRHTDIFPLPRLKLEDVQNPCHTHLEEHGGAAAAKLHDVTQLSGVKVLLGHRPGWFGCGSCLESDVCERVWG